MPVRVVLADDHVAFRRQVKAFLRREGFRVVGEADNGTDALMLVRKLRPDLVLLDYDLPDPNGIAVVRFLHASRPRFQAILLTTNYDRQYILRALRAGASGYVLKSRVADELVAAIRKVHGGEIHVPLDARAAVV